jgi:reverse gyrase
MDATRDGLEIVQQGIKPDKTLKTHGVIRPTRPMKPDEFKALVKKDRCQTF